MRVQRITHTLTHSPSSPSHTDTKPDQDQKEEEIKVLDAGDIQLLKTYGQGPYASALKKIEKEIEDIRKRVNEKMGVKESETGLAPPNLVSRQGLVCMAWSLAAKDDRHPVGPRSNASRRNRLAPFPVPEGLSSGTMEGGYHLHPSTSLTASYSYFLFLSQWDIPADKQRMGEEHPLQVARCTKIIPGSITLAAQAAARQQANAAAANGDASASSSSDSTSSAPSQPPAQSAPPARGGLGGLAGALGGGGDRKPNADEEDKYVINVKQIAKFVVGLGDKVASTDIEEGMRVG